MRRCENVCRGQPGDIPVSNCDFDADGVTDFTVWTPRSGIWSWIPSASPWLVYQRQWGSRYDIPLCADFDGDKKEILLSTEVGLENGLSFLTVFQHSLLRFNGVVQLIFQLLEIMMEMDEVIALRKL